MGGNIRKWLHKTDDGWAWLDWPPEHPSVVYQDPWRRALRSYAMGCHPDQVAEFNEKAAPGVEYEPGTGVCIIRGREGRREEQHRRGLFDRDAGYGDNPGG